jgi:hypothetical protein
MPRLLRLPLLVLAGLSLTTTAVAGEAERAAVIGQPLSLSVRPETVRLSGPRAVRQLLVTGHYAGAIERDLTPFCLLSAETAGVVTVGPGGFLQPAGDGSTTLVVQAGACTARVPVVVTGCDQPEPVSFRREFIAALNVAGCNQGACHGIPSGRGGFRLSLRGYNPTADYQELTRDVLGRRTNRLDPEASLIYLKALGRVPHEGGQRFGVDSVPAHVMRTWLKQGMPDDPAAPPALVKLEVAPGPRVRVAPARWQQLAVLAKADPLEPGGPRRAYPWMLREDALVVYSERTGEVVHPRTGQVMAPKIMGMPAPAIPPGKDRRQVLADLITAADNPFFARATVNRIWFHLLGRGIVDPPDDFRDSNPPANDALLDALAADFVAGKFDVKRLIRVIMCSRTYQLSSHASPAGPQDEKYFSHALVKRKRLPAEVLLDAICTATAVPEKFTGFPPGTRAVELPDGQVIDTGGQYASWDRHPFLKAFGQPAREMACECEREGDLNLARVLELKNGDLVYKKLQTPDNRIGKLLARKAADKEVVEELFLATLSRPPLPEEARAALDVVAKAQEKRAAWEAVQWALLNTNEFLFRH